MPFEHLVLNFNERFARENAPEAPALHFDGTTVWGNFTGHRFSSQFSPIRQRLKPSSIYGHDSSPSSLQLWNEAGKNLRGETVVSDLVRLDRLSRTVHMLNYLLREPEISHLFLHVHPQHVLGVPKDHGAYFEDIIGRLGLPLRSIVIGLTLAASELRVMPTLLERFRNYRDRGYSIAISLGEGADVELVSYFQSQVLSRWTPDHVRLDAALLRRIYPDARGLRHQLRLIEQVRQRDAILHLYNVRTQGDLESADFMASDFIQGDAIEQNPNKTPGPDAIQDAPSSPLY